MPLDPICSLHFAGNPLRCLSLDAIPFSEAIAHLSHHAVIHHASDGEHLSTDRFGNALDKFANDLSRNDRPSHRFTFRPLSYSSLLR